MLLVEGSVGRHRFSHRKALEDGGEKEDLREWCWPQERAHGGAFTVWQYLCATQWVVVVSGF
jgi:hypothetical protein